MMSRTELQLLIRVELTVAPVRDDGGLFIGNKIARLIGIESLQRRRFARGIASVLRDMHRRGEFDSHAVTGAVADWVLEQVTE